jgi:hypothetical protein
MINIPTFQGMNNAIAARLINDNQATSASNCIVRRGNLTPLKNNNIENLPTLINNVETLFLYSDQYWFSWDSEVHAVKSPIAQDEFERVYITGDGVPKYTNSAIATGLGVLPFATYELGFDAPNIVNINAVTYYDQSLDLEPDDDVNNYNINDLSGFINIDTEDDETRFYVCTYVSAYGEESVNSLTSTQVELLYEKDTVELQFSDIGGFGNVNITKRRIYRTATGGDTTEFFLVDEIPVSQSTYVDSKKVFELGAQLATEDYVKPPSNMKGIINTINGSVIGFAENEIIPSEPYLPYAYPLGYRQSISDNVVGLVETTSGIVIATDNKPVIMQGASPDSYTLYTIDAGLPCVSSKSIVDMGELAMYASIDGLVAVTQSQAEIITKDILSREYWESLNPSSMSGYRYDNYYVGFYGNSAGFVFDIRTGNFFELDFYAKAGYYKSSTGELFLCVGDNFVTFDNGANTTFYWKSKDFEMTDTHYSCAKVRGENLSGAELAIFADDVEIMRITLNGFVNTFRLPPFRCSVLNIEVNGNAIIKSISLAQSMQELANV